LVHGIDEQLDANAMDALSQWKFRPALKQGAPVELEAIVHIPSTLRATAKSNLPPMVLTGFRYAMSSCCW
jgi:hypothetical protein